MLDSPVHKLLEYSAKFHRQANDDVCSQVRSDLSRFVMVGLAGQTNSKNVMAAEESVWIVSGTLLTL